VQEALRPSLEEAYTIQDKEKALDYIGKRGAAPGVVAAQRIEYARSLLRKEFLPHIGTGEHCETKKAYFLGYMVHKLLLTHLKRRPEDDRDHFANKRMDMAGALLGQLFRQLFYNLTKQTAKLIRQRVQDRKGGRTDFPLAQMVDPKMVGRGLKYSLATGNWVSALCLVLLTARDSVCLPAALAVMRLMHSLVVMVWSVRAQVAWPAPRPRPAWLRC
jgi:DNA-directed RNA polymerase II subunit RPB2